MSSAGIALDFNVDGEVETYLKDDTPECLSGKCDYVKFVRIQLDEVVGYYQLYCTKAGKPVFDIYRKEGVCPDNRWSKI